LRRCVAEENLGGSQCQCGVLSVLRELVPTYTPEPNTLRTCGH